MIKSVLLLAAVGAAFVIPLLLPAGEGQPPVPAAPPAAISDLFDVQPASAVRRELPPGH